VSAIAHSSLERSCQFTFASSNFCWFDFEKLPMLRSNRSNDDNILCDGG